MWKAAVPEKHTSDVWSQTELGSSPGHVILDMLLLICQSPSILICRMGIKIHHLHGISVRMK